MADDFSIEDLVAQTNEAAETLLDWQALGLLGGRGGSLYSMNDVLRARVVRIVLRRGLGLEVIARLQQVNPFLDREVERLFPRGLQPRYSIEEAAERAGVDIEMAARFSKAGNIGDEEGLLAEEDVVAFRAVKRIVNGGFPEEALLQTIRVLADVTERAAQASQRAFHMYVHQPLLASGMAPDKAIDATEEVSEYTSPAIEPTLIYLYRKALAKQLRDDVALHVAEGAGLSTIPAVPGEVSRAVMFVDLSSFMPLVEAMGDRAAADVLERLSSLVREATGRTHGHVVKQIGDAFMLVFPDAKAAVTAAFEIEESTSLEPQFPAAHSGIHCGRVLYREGDYIGAVVNVASRIVSEADRHQIVVTAEVRDESKGLEEAEFVALGKRKLKGVADGVELFEVRRLQQRSASKTIDLVCGMELGPGEAVARLVLAGAERAFCSDNCLKLFVEAPERYVRRSAN